MQSAYVAGQLLASNEPRIRFAGIDFFGPYDPLKMAPIRERFRNAAAGVGGYTGSICFFDVEIEAVERAAEVSTV